MIERELEQGFGWRAKLEFFAGPEGYVEIDDGNYGVIISRAREEDNDIDFDWVVEVRTDDKESYSVTQAYFLSNNFGLMSSTESIRLPEPKNILGIDYAKHLDENYDETNYVFSVNAEHLDNEEREDYHDLADALLDKVDEIYMRAQIERARKLIRQVHLGSFEIAPPLLEYNYSSSNK